MKGQDRSSVTPLQMTTHSEVDSVFYDDSRSRATNGARKYPSKVNWTQKELLTYIGQINILNKKGTHELKQ